MLIYQIYKKWLMITCDLISAGALIALFTIGTPVMGEC